MVDAIRRQVLREAEEQLKFDPYAHAITVISEQHRLLHDGMFFTTTGKETGWLDGATKEFLIRCPAGNFPHIQQMLLNFGRGDIDFVAYEGPTVTSPGGALTVVNPNRSSARTADLLLYGSPTTSDDGTHIFTLWVPPTGTGTGQSANGIADTGQGTEWVLDESTDYLIRLTNNSGATIAWAWEFSWYEIGYDINDRENTPA